MMVWCDGIGMVRRDGMGVMVCVCDGVCVMVWV